MRVFTYGGRVFRIRWGTPKTRLDWTMTLALGLLLGGMGAVVLTVAGKLAQP
jgi:hypothetical protein